LMVRWRPDASYEAGHVFCGSFATDPFAAAVASGPK